MRKNLILILRIIVVVASLVFLFFKVDVKQMFFEVLIKLPVWVLLSSVGLAVFRTWLNGIRWKLLNTDFSNQLNNWDYFRYMMISSTFNLIMPGALGGDVVKAIWVGNDLEKNKARNVLSIFFDRAIGIFSIILLGLLAFSLSPFFIIRGKIVVWVLTFIVFIFIILLVKYIKNGTINKKILGWRPKKNIMIKAKNLFLTINNIVVFYIKKPIIFLNALLLSILIHLSFFTYSYLIAYFLDINISFFDLSMVNCLVWLITAVPISISGLGVREVSYMSLLGLYGILPERATVLSLYIFLVAIILGILGLPFVFSGKTKKGSKL